MEIKLTETDLQEASKDYIAKLGFNLTGNEVHVTISQSKLAIVNITVANPTSDKPKSAITAELSTEKESDTADINDPFDDDTSVI